jgi:hypothetical protein
MDPIKDFAAEAMAVAADSRKDEKYPQAWRYVIGLREGWETRKAVKVAAREAATDEG